MPTPSQLTNLEIDFSSGYFPSAPALSPEGLLRTIRAGSNVWLRPFGKIEVADGLDEVSSTNVGARLFAANTDRVSIEGDLNGNLLPYAGFLRFQNAVFFFLSEETDAQVYINEVAISGLTTSSTPGRLRVAIRDGVGGYDVFDAGFDRPELFAADVTVTAGISITAGVIGAIDMSGQIGVAIAPWRPKTGAIGPPSTIVYNTITLTGSTATGNIVSIQLPAMVSGQDGWIFCGTRWGDQSGTLQVVRRVYTQPRGTFTAVNGDDTLIGDGTLWTQDLRPNDLVTTESSSYSVQNVISDTEVELLTNFTGTSGSGKVMTITDPAGAWYDSSLEELVSMDPVKAPRAAGVLIYAGRLFVWGVPDTTDPNPTQPTGNAILATLDGNPEHVSDTLAIATASGSNLVNVLPGDGVMYLMTFTSLEVVSFTGNPAAPYIIRIAGEPGFKAGTNGVVYKDRFYGFSNRPLRTTSNGDIDVEFADPVTDDMAGWNGERVIVNIDPENEAVLYIFDNGSTTTVRPYMAQRGVWNAPINFSARILDAQVVNGVLYVTYLDGGNIRVNEWEGGAGMADAFIASQYYDPNFLNRNRIKRLLVTGNAEELRVYSAQPGAAVPDVSDAGSGELFTLSNTNISESEIYTKLEGRAHAFRVDFPVDGTLDKIIARGTPVSEQR